MKGRKEGGWRGGRTEEGRREVHVYRLGWERVKAVIVRKVGALDVRVYEQSTQHACQYRCALTDYKLN